ncbi:MAG TPA: carboxylesterase family protein [Stellaceae bacterium]|nr:carboxylesterase family protein [Stellaceae bacterium]
MARIGDTVRIESGLLAGCLEPGGVVRSFKGIPYARAPVGDLRWRPPLAPERWDGIRAATHFAPRCVQPERPITAIGSFAPERESEDCLYLNIWTAAVADDDTRPVMVWFHGGGYAVGSGAVPLFTGAKLARKGVVVVTVNYRLGRLGFLAHPELSRESDARVSGNYGLLDQIASLRWVERNIGSFGGDPGRITVFGQSAGASSVHCMTASPLAKGAFQRAIGQSGGALGWRAMAPLDAAERAGMKFAHALGTTTLAALRALPARAIQLVRPNEGGRLKEIYDSSDPGGLDRETAWAVIDGHVLPEPVHDVFARGGQNDVPLLTGSTRDEGSTLPHDGTLDHFVARARTDYGAMADRFLDLYPAASDEAAERAAAAAVGDRTFTWENWLWARLQAATGRLPAFYYRFNRAPPRPLESGGGDRSRALGAFHTAEIPYVFHHLEVRAWPWHETDRALSDTMSSYWVNFAASGDPNGAGLPHWPRFDERLPSVMHFGDETRVGALPDAARLAFWSDVDAQLRAG